MAGFDPDAFAASGGLSAEERQQQAQQAQPAGGMMGDIKGKWDSFIDHPENRAGLMQFAVNMLSGRGLGESIGSAAEAQSRNIGAQEAEQQYEDTQAMKEREEARKELETQYYGIAARKKSGADTYYEHLAANEAKANRLAGEGEFDRWMADALPDSRFKALQRRHPELKGKEDLWDPKNAAIRNEARGMFRGLGQEGGSSTPPPNSEIRVGKDGRNHYFDKTTHKYLGDAP